MKKDKKVLKAKKVIKRASRKKVKALVQMLTPKEKKSLRDARQKSKVAVGSKRVRPSVKSWVAANKVEAKKQMEELGLIKKGT